ncbi:hypothetical protein BGX21_004433 [Mortierella sp. AD011]|nr:hypothetical protein BGX20_010824 [Mortierella sp. AD010]KAF9373412.1 hypothetical protein BGX21_004433 [Mortierella sp. AD011]
MADKADVAKGSGKIEKADEPKTIRRGYKALKIFSLVGSTVIVPVLALKEVGMTAMMAMILGLTEEDDRL